MLKMFKIVVCLLVACIAASGSQLRKQSQQQNQYQQSTHQLVVASEESAVVTGTIAAVKLIYAIYTWVSWAVARVKKANAQSVQVNNMRTCVPL